MAAGAIASYIVFATFEPLTLPEPNKNVKGIKTLKSTFEVPSYPDANEMGQDQKYDSNQVTLSTKDPIEKVHSYYKNVFESKGFKQTKEIKFSQNYFAKYKKLEEEVSVSITKDSATNGSIISIENTKD